MAAAHEPPSDDIIKAYAALVAIAFRPIAEVNDWLANNPIPDLRWAPELIADIRASYVSIIGVEATWERDVNSMTPLNRVIAVTTLQRENIPPQREIPTIRPRVTANTAVQAGLSGEIAND